MAAKVASPTEWRAARVELLAKEKELTRALDALTRQRQALPMVKVTEDYRFGGAGGATDLPLADLFASHRQLLVYHFMFDPADDQGCPNCSFFADQVPAHLQHLNARDTAFACVSRAPMAKIEPFKERMGWSFPWFSSHGSSFNYDFHVTSDSVVKPVEYNYKSQSEVEQKMPWHAKGEQPGLSAFYRADDGQIYHTYSAYARGLDHVLGTYNLLDMTLLGRQEDGPNAPDFKYHDKY